MAFGTLYTHNPTPRSTTILALAKLNGLDLDIVYVEKRHKESFTKLCEYNPLGQVPTFVGSDGYVLSECIPLTLYFASQGETPTTLLGSCDSDTLEILKWMSFANSDLFPAIGGVFLPLVGQRQVVRQHGDDSLRAMLHRCSYLDGHLKNSKYLVGESLTVADFFVVSLIFGAWAAFRRDMMERFPALSQWYKEVSEVEWYREVAGEAPDLGLPLPNSEVLVESHSSL
ncbi:glutathione S-transferase [Aspergillus karnatakaensis]|uniref:glutathione S-transferase family protein n=1 Tax=Aspergillus karnatakaensis TaxID=1810916 RepID=UPI003CCCE310